MSHWLILLLAINTYQITAIDYFDHVSSGTDYNTQLKISDVIYSLNGKTLLRFGKSGQLIVQTYIGNVWESQWGNEIKAGTNAILSIQSDGNLVVYAGDVAQWSTQSNNAYPPQHLVVSDDGYAYMLNSKNIVTWSTTGITNNLPTFAAPTSATITPSVPQTNIPTPSPVPDFSICSGNFYSDPIAITDSNSIGTIRIGDITEISFMFKVNSRTWTCTSGWCHILRIGPLGAGVRLPLISIASADQSLHVPYSGLNTYDETGATDMLDGNEHSFYFKHTPTNSMFVFDGKTLMNWTTATPFVNREVGNVHDIWVCDQGNPWAVDGYIWDLCVHSMTTTTTSSSPTSSSPTSSSPTSRSSTTNTPTTNVPTTIIPTTNMPTTDMPTTNMPTTNMPSTDMPTTDIPTTNIPTTAGPTTTVPTTDIPSTYVPTTQQPVTSIPITNLPTFAPTDSIENDSGEQSVDESKTTQSESHNAGAGLESEGTTLTQKVITLVALSVIIIIILLCVICSIVIIVKKMRNKKMSNTNSNDKSVEMNRVLSFSQSPSTQAAHHITAVSSVSNITPQMRTMGYKNNDINEGLDMNDITTTLPLPEENNEINLEEPEPDNAGSHYVTKGGYVNNNYNTPTGDDINEGSESDHDGLYTKNEVATPQYVDHNENDLFDDDDDDDDDDHGIYKKPVNKNTGTLQ